MPTFTPAASMLLKRLEGLRERAYQDDAGVLTVGYGHTGKDVRPDTVWSIDEAEAALDRDIARFSTGVSHALDGAVQVLTNPQFSALVIFCFNVGIEAFMGSTLRRVVLAGHLEAVPDQLMRWTKIHLPDGSVAVSPGLLKRRQAEVELWNEGRVAS